MPNNIDNSENETVSDEIIRYNLFTESLKIIQLQY